MLTPARSAGSATSSKNRLVSPFSCPAGDLHSTERNILCRKEISNDFPDRSAGGEHRGDRRTEDVSNACNIDTATTGIMSGTLTAELVGGTNLIHTGRDVEARIHRQGHDRHRISMRDSAN